MGKKKGGYPAYLHLVIRHLYVINQPAVTLGDANPHMVKVVTLDRWMSHAVTNADLALESSEIPLVAPG